MEYFKLTENESGRVDTSHAPFLASDSEKKCTWSESIPNLLSFHCICLCVLINDLQVRKIEQALQKLRRGDKLPPSALGQGLLMQGFNSSTGGVPASPGAPRAARSLPSSRPVAAAAGLRKYALLRIWQSMSGDAPFMTLEIDPALGKS